MRRKNLTQPEYCAIILVDATQTRCVMPQEYVGSYYLLGVLPIWATALVLYFGTLGVIHVGRDYFEGLPYQVAYSAQFGDAALFGSVLIAATILQRSGISVPAWLQSAGIHWLIGGGSFLLGAFISVATAESRSGQLMDIYHDVVVGPLILYFAITLLPVIFLNGTKIEIAATIGLALFWACLVVFDIDYKRMDQRTWLKNNGVTLRD